MKRSEVGKTAPSVASLLDTAIVTFALGRVSSRTLNDACPPASVVCRPDVGVTTMPAASIALQAENSDVSNNSVSIARPVTTLPTVRLFG